MAEAKTQKFEFEIPEEMGATSAETMVRKVAMLCNAIVASCLKGSVTPGAPGLQIVFGAGAHLEQASYQMVPQPQGPVQIGPPPGGMQRR